MKILVIGDIIVDRWIEGHAYKLSPEAPVPAIKVEKTRESLGAAGHVALSIGALGCGVTLAGPIGTDYIPPSNTYECLAYGVAPLYEMRHKSIKRTRVIADGQQIARLDENVDIESSDGYRKLVLNRIPQYDAVVIVDYAKGAVPYIFAKDILESCATYNKPLIINSKSKDFSRFYGTSKQSITLIGTVAEIKQGFWRDDSSIAAASVERLVDLLKDKVGTINTSIIVTNGADGMWLVDKRRPCHIPAVHAAVVDTTGAGDTVTAVIAAGVARGKELVLLCNIAALAAAVAVSKLYCHVVLASEISRPLVEQVLL